MKKKPVSTVGSDSITHSSFFVMHFLCQLGEYQLTLYHTMTTFDALEEKACWKHCKKRKLEGLELLYRSTGLIFLQR